MGEKAAGCIVHIAHVAMIPGTLCDMGGVSVLFRPSPLFGLVGLPPGVAEVGLFIVILGAIGWGVRAFRRREKFLPVPDTDLPDLQTQGRVTATVRRVYRDPAQNVWLVEASVGKRRITFCAIDYTQNAEGYQGAVGEKADVALFGTATLAPGGAEAMRDQIKDIDKVDLSKEPVRLIPAGQFANDHVVIGRVLSHRTDTMSGFGVNVYRTQVARTDDFTLVFELATDTAGTPFTAQSMVHGAARLYGYLGNRE
jgi:hypothetical protein